MAPSGYFCQLLVEGPKERNFGVSGYNLSLSWVCHMEPWACNAGALRCLFQISQCEFFLSPQKLT